MGWPKGKPKSESTRRKMSIPKASLVGNINGRKVGWAPIGMSQHKLFLVYYSMIQRCFNPKNPRYKHYGQRGITVCERWLELDGQGFLNFLSDMGERPEGITKSGKAAYTLERKDNDGNYEPSNCIWATYSQQNFNQRVIPKRTT